MPSCKAVIILVLATLFILLQSQSTLAICNIKTIKKVGLTKKITEGYAKEEAEDEDTEEEGVVKVCHTMDLLTLVTSPRNRNESAQYILELHSKYFDCFNPPPELK